ncbi:SecY-interacting protein [Glaciecola sp. MH2013]|uniref:SecY-interacting protein n=1 Tax=Glaciecola sp. MH2013 TaxID=2785524 RepID=UPI00189F262B|nr:SecY-interacting protein [Glaciecola sp. MH2013]MBF7072257.1 SecY-interacting protein [Glaciecola sp. MH2013]
MHPKSDLTAATQTLNESLDQFISSYIGLLSDDNSQIMTEYDSEWPSPCIQLTSEDLNATADGSEVPWQPVLRNDGVTLNNIAEALEIEIDPQLSALFCRYYSHDLPAVTERGELEILQAWNEEDFDRLQKNLIAHVLMKRRLKQPETLFFATTDQEEFIISLELATGNVVLEQVGKLPKEVLAPDIATFIDSLKPRAVVVTL